jgi:hypothetical protein
MVLWLNLDEAGSLACIIQRAKMSTTEIQLLNSQPQSSEGAYPATGLIECLPLDGWGMYTGIPLFLFALLRGWKRNGIRKRSESCTPKRRHIKSHWLAIDVRIRFACAMEVA